MWSKFANVTPALGKSVLKICSKLTGEHPCRNAISIKLLSNFIEIALRHGCSPVICCIFSKHLFLKTPLEGCFCLIYCLFVSWRLKANCFLTKKRNQETIQQWWLHIFSKKIFKIAENEYVQKPNNCKKQERTKKFSFTMKLDFSEA